MYEPRELTGEQIGTVLGVRRTSIYRGPGRDSGATATTVPPAASARAPVTRAGVAVAVEQMAVPGAAALAAPARQALPAVRSRGSVALVRAGRPGRPGVWPVAVLSGHTSQMPATALGKPSSRASARPSLDVGERALLQVRPATQITSRLVWDAGRTGRRAARAAPWPVPAAAPRSPGGRRRAEPGRRLRSGPLKRDRRWSRRHRTSQQAQGRCACWAATSRPAAAVGQRDAGADPALVTEAARGGAALRANLLTSDRQGPRSRVSAALRSATVPQPLEREKLKDLLQHSC